jgi:microsomal prostaglandin-E synthase 2
MVIYVGAFTMYLIGKHLKRKHNLKADVRDSLYDACNHFLKQKGAKRTFMGGEQPNLADLAVYGVLSSIEGCEAFDDLQTHTKISGWYDAVKHRVQAQATLKQ